MHSPTFRSSRSVRASVDGTPVPAGSGRSITVCRSRPRRSVPTPGNYLAFVGRVAPEKGVADAIALARSVGLTLRMAAKVYDPAEMDLFEEVVRPAIDDGIVEFLGELGPDDRDAVFAGSLATVMLGSWPEPFGLVAIESMATGTPVIARRAGALPETVRHGRDGFVVDDLPEARLAVARAAGLDRTAIRSDAIERFSVGRMVDQYEAVYRQLVAEARGEAVAVRGRSARDLPAVAVFHPASDERTSVPA